MFTITFYVTMGAFIALCAWFSWRSGHKAGLTDGMDITLQLLQDQGFIEVVDRADGDQEILPPKRYAQYDKNI
jgi:hypothetical protein